MRKSRVFRLLFRIFISLLTLSVTVVSILGGLSAVSILMNPNNIGFDFDNADFQIDYDLSGFHGANFTLPFNITNDGYFDLENLQLRIELKMNYSKVDYFNGTYTPGVNGTDTVKIFESNQTFGTIPKGLTGNFNITGLNSDFAPFLGNFPNITEIDIFQPSPIMEFFANFTISLDYSLGLHSVVINLFNWPVYEIDSIIP